MLHARRRQPRVHSASMRLVAVAAAAAVLTSACAVHDWKAVAVPRAAEETQLARARVRILTLSGWVDMEVARAEFPYLEGRAWPGEGQVSFDLRTATRFGEPLGAGMRRMDASLDRLQHAALVGKLWLFETAEGSLALHVTAREGSVVQGRPAGCAGQPCPGRVTVDLREVRRMELRSLNDNKTVGRTLLGMVAGAAVLFGLWLLSLSGDWYTRERLPGR